MGSSFGSGIHWWAWGLGIALAIIFWALVIWAIVALVSWAHHGRSGPGGPGGPGGPDAPRGPWAPDHPHRMADPEEIPTRRYAAGETDAGEYHGQLDRARSRQFATAGSGHER